MAYYLGLCIAALLAGCATHTELTPEPAGPAIHRAPPKAEAPPPASAALSGTPASLADLLPLLLERNPHVRAARERWRSQVQQVTLSRSLPDPKLMLTVFAVPVETRGGPQDHKLGITQAIPFPAKLSLAADSAAVGARVREMAYRITLRNAVVALKDAYIERWYLARSARITKGHVALLEQLRATVERGRADGTATVADLLRLRSQQAQLEYDLLTLTELTTVNQAAINALVDREGDAPLGEPGDLPAPLQLEIPRSRLLELGEANRQELASARLQLEQAGIDVSRARWARAPDFTIGGTLIDIGEGPMDGPISGRNASAVMLGMSIPLWVRKNRARVEKAQATERARTAMVAGERRKLEKQLAMLSFRLRNATRLAELYGSTLLPQAEQAARLAREWYQGGQGGVAHLLEVQAVLFNYHLAYDRARADFHQQLNRLEALLGVSLRTEEAK